MLQKALLQLRRAVTERSCILYLPQTLKELKYALDEQLQYRKVYYSYHFD